MKLDFMVQSKQVTNGSKTAVLDVIGFLCLSLGSSTVQVADAHVQRLVSVVKMVIVLEVCTSKEQHCVVHFCFVFCGQKDSMEKLFIRTCFLFTVGSVCHVKQFTNGSRNSLGDVQKVQMMPGQVWKWLR
jgi:uncharacterized membrane protein YqgA involved in biofilm formation